MANVRFPPLSRATACAVLIGMGASLGGCIGNSALDNLEYTKPVGTAFDTALYENYSFLARSFGDVGEAQRAVFDYNGSYSLNGVEKDIASLANTFAEKAVESSRAEFVDPEAARDPASHEMRDRILRALEPARTLFPRDAARVQADFDCWILNGRIPAQKSASEHCLASLQKVLPRLETAIREQQAKLAAQKKPEGGEQ